MGVDVPENLEIHPTHLGAWKNEGTFVDSKYIRAKTYMETMETFKNDSLKTYATEMSKNYNRICSSNISVQVGGVFATPRR